jgi:6-pyruvoyltetrahydropterin/6-carboxytetrahydropterin synthase
MHGHRYVVEVALATEQLDESGIAFDFVHVKKHLRDLAERLDHENLNDLSPFDTVEPSAENQAKYFYDELRRLLPEGMGDAVIYTRVWETPTQWAQYTERQIFL